MSAFCLTPVLSASGQTPQQAPVFNNGPAYRPVPNVMPGLVQVIYFRGNSASQKAGGANVYVNGEFHTALWRDSYTRICLRPGTYSLEAYIGDAPLYAGKTAPKTQVKLEDGGTYFVGVSEGGSGAPIPVVRAEAERLLQGSHEQRRFVNRASAVVPCVDAAAPSVVAPPNVNKPDLSKPLLQFKLNAAVLFGFGQSSLSDITVDGREELRKIASEIQTLRADSIGRIEVRGHADPIGSEISNQRLSTERARTVSQVLSQAGIPADLIVAEGMGSSEPVVKCSTTGALSVRERCNAPNRRVEINVYGVGSAKEAAPQRG